MVFSSELKPIMLFPKIKKEINTNALEKLLLKGYVNAPYSILSNVFKLEPGEILEIESFKLRKYKFWDLAKVNKKYESTSIKDLEEAKCYFNELLVDAVDKRLEADVPLRCLLFGGYDSSLVAADAQKTW